MRLAIQISMLLVPVMLGSCVTKPTQDSTLAGHPVSAEMLLASSPIADGAELEDLSDIDMLYLTPDMKQFVDGFAESGLTTKARLQRLLYAVIKEGKFNLVYDDRTRTAQETFQERRGNCLSFTNMFVAMARYIELDAVYQEVDVPPDWSLSGQSFLLSKHVNVLVDLGTKERVVDFNVYDIDINFDKNVISDQRGRAHYFNNMGVEHMLAGDTELAIAHFLQSLQEDRYFSPAWLNLGILHRREGYSEYAESAYLQALKVDSQNLVAMSNLASLYQEMGYEQDAERYRSRVESHRMENPYYRYMLAQEDFINGDYQSAINHLKHAIRKHDNEDLFYSLLSTNYLMMGDRKSAKRWLQKAEEAAAMDENKQRYQNKLDLLMSQDSET
jgi:Flp pilus assembly protein TadD